MLKRWRQCCVTPVAALTREEKRQQCFFDGDGSNVTGDISMRQRRATATVCRNGRRQQGSDAATAEMTETAGRAGKATAAKASTQQRC